MSNNIHAVFDAYERIDKLGDDWAKIDELVDFESFRLVLEECWRREINPAKGGRPPWDAVLMFKILLIGKKTGMSDERLEYVLSDSLSLRRFIGRDLDQAVPDRTTIARYRSELDEDTVRDLFEMFDEQLQEVGFAAKSGQMLDSTFVLVPIQRNSREENQDIKEGKTPDDWTEDSATSKLRQKDLDARWTKKHGKNVYGYKNHICADVKHKLIRGYVVTPANDHDITVADALIDRTQKGGPLYADAAYRSSEFEQELRAGKIQSRVMFKRQPDEDLTPYQKRANKERSRVRVRVEHIFGSMKNELSGTQSRRIGLKRNQVEIGLESLLYNLFRFKSLVAPENMLI